MTVRASINLVNGAREIKHFSGWPDMMAYITDNWEKIEDFYAKVETASEIMQGRERNG